MKTTIAIFIMTLIALIPLPADEVGTEIAASYFAMPRPLTLEQTMTMVLTNRQGQERTRSLVMMSRKDGTREQSLIEFKSPPDVAGTRFLTLSQAGSAQEQRLYLPSLKKIRKISGSGSSKQESFMGSDFTNYDLEERYFDEFTYRFEGDAEIDGKAVRKVAWIPKSADVPYSRLLVFHEAATSFPLRIDYFDKADVMVKQLENINLDRDGDFMFARTQIMATPSKGTKTTLKLSDLRSGLALDANLFTIQGLSR